MLPEEYIRNFLDEQGRLKAFPAKRKMKVYSLLYLSGKLQDNTVYSEKELNGILCQWHTFHDPATLRREMYNCGLIDRNPHTAEYSKAKDSPGYDDIMKKYG